MSRLDAYLADLRREFPRFRVVRKDRSPSQRAIHYALVVLTFGRMRRYLDEFLTTIGRTIYVPPGWDDLPPDRRYVLLRHEAVHLRQFRRLGLPLMALLYLLLPLPMGLAWFRARFEQEAYAETIRAAAEVAGPSFPRQEAFRASVIEAFTGPAYGWMWPFRASLERWYDRVLASIDSPA